MSGIVGVYISKEQVAQVAEAVAEVPRGLSKVLSRAINKVAVKARTQMLKMITGEINVKRKDLRDHNLKLRRASYDKLYARLTITGARIPVFHFKSRQTKRGVSYAIRKGLRKKIPTAFQESKGTPIVMPNRGKPSAGGFAGHRGVFVRSGAWRVGRTLAPRTNRRRGTVKGMAGLVRPRLPIRELLGPSIPEVVRTARQFASKTYHRLMDGLLAAEVDTQVEVLLEQFEKGKKVAPF